MTAKLSLAEAIRKSPYFAQWLDDGRGANVLRTEQTCPRCGDVVVCGYAERGVSDSYHTFAHACLNPVCDWFEDCEVYEGNRGGGGTLGGTVCCGLCGRDNAVDYLRPG